MRLTVAAAHMISWRRQSERDEQIGAAMAAGDLASARLIACYGHVPDFAKRQRCQAGETSEGEASVTIFFDLPVRR